MIAELWTTEDYYLAGAECQTKDIDLAVISRSYVRFIMPASNVTVVLDIKGKISVSAKTKDGYDIPVELSAPYASFTNASI